MAARRSRPTLPPPAGARPLGAREAADLWFAEGDRALEAGRVPATLAAFERAAETASRAGDSGRAMDALLEAGAAQLSLDRRQDFGTTVERLQSIRQAESWLAGAWLRARVFAAIAARADEDPGAFSILVRMVRRARRHASRERPAEPGPPRAPGPSRGVEPQLLGGARSFIPVRAETAEEDPAGTEGFPWHLAALAYDAASLTFFQPIALTAEERATLEAEAEAEDRHVEPRTAEEAGLTVEIVAGRIFVHWLALVPIPGDPPLAREISRAILDASAPHGFRFVEA